MGESAKHLQLVEQIIAYIQNILEVEIVLIQSDLPNCNNKPNLTMEGYRPDVYYNYRNFMVIGEAKTSADVATKHSIRQYSSYLKKCSLFSGSAILIVAVPWTESKAVRNILKKISTINNYKVEIIIINDVGKVENV